MTSETIIRVIDDMNGKQKNEFSIQAISSNVDFSIHTVIQDPNPTYQRNTGRMYRFYLIKNDQSKYIAAVYDMGGDLHWVVLPKERGRAVLIHPLKDVIIPHLLKDRDEVKLSIDAEIGDEFFNASEKLALKLGFIKTVEEDGASWYSLKP